MPADDGRRWSLLLPQGGEQGGFVFRRHRQQQATGGLRIHAEVSIRRAEIGRPLHPVGRREFRSVPPDTTPREARFRACGRMGSASNAISAATLLASSMLVRWPIRPNPVTSVAALTPTFSAARAAPSFNVVMDRTASAMPVSRSASRFNAVARMPVPRGLVSTRTIAGTCAGVGQHPVGVDLTDHRHPEDRLDGIDRMATEDQTPRPLGYLRGSPEHLGQHLERDPVPGPAEQVEGKQWRGPHRVDVAQRVGGRDGSPGCGVVHDGGEEVHGRDQGPVGRQQKNRGVIPGSGVDEDPGVHDAGQMAQDLRQVGWAELAGSTGAVRECGETDTRLLVDRGVGHPTSPSRPRSMRATR